MVKTKLLLDVVCDLRRLADSVQAVAEVMTNPTEDETLGSPALATAQKSAEKTVTLEQVRVVLANKSRDGFKAERMDSTDSSKKNFRKNVDLSPPPWLTGEGHEI